MFRGVVNNLILLVLALAACSMTFAGSDDCSKHLTPISRIIKGYTKLIEESAGAALSDTDIQTLIESGDYFNLPMQSDSSFSHVIHGARQIQDLIALWKLDTVKVNAEIKSALHEILKKRQYVSKNNIADKEQRKLASPLLRTFQAPHGVKKIFASPDGTRLFILRESGLHQYFSFWDLKSGTLITEACSLSDRGVDASFSPDNSNFVAAWDYGSQKVFDPKTFEELHPKKQSKREFDSPIAVAHSNDGKYFATLWHNGRNHEGWIEVTDVKTFKTVMKRKWGSPFDRDSFRTVAFLPDNKTIVTGSQDGRLHFWKLNTSPFSGLWSKPTELSVGRGFLSDVAIESIVPSPDLKWIALGLSNGRVWIYALDKKIEGKPAFDFSLWKDGRVRKLAFTPDSQHIVASAGFSMSPREKTPEVQIWDFKAKKQVNTLEETLDFSIISSKNQLVTTSKYSQIRIYDIPALLTEYSY